MHASFRQENISQRAYKAVKTQCFPKFRETTFVVASENVVRATSIDGRSCYMLLGTTQENDIARSDLPIR